MCISHRFSQYLFKVLLVFSMNGLAIFALAQNPATPETPAPLPASEAPPAEKPIYSSTNERDDALLAKAKPDEIQWLETPNEKLLALYKAAETAKPKGSLLILHAPELPQLWPAPLDNLRRNLPIYGWATLALPLPQKYPAPIPAQDAQAEAKSSESSEAASSSSAASSEASSDTASASSAASSKATLPRAQLITERVDAAISQLNKAEKSPLIILTDNSVAPDGLAALYKKIDPNSKMKDGPLQALVLVNLQEQEALTKEQLNALFAVAELPVMDVFFGRDDTLLAELRRTHQAVAMQHKLKDYQQVVLPPETFLTINDKQSFWLEKVRGFMERKILQNQLQEKAESSAK